MISVIVAIYNVAPYLRQCIQSLVDQTHSDMEIILVNDGSTDESPQICDYYQGIDKRVIVIHKENEGLVKARKTGLELSRGTYVAYVDGDDWVEKDMYKTLMEEAIHFDADIVAAGHKEEINGNVVEVLSNTIPVGLYTGDDRYSKIYSQMLANTVFSEFGVYSYLWNKIFRKSILYTNQMKVDDRIFIAEDAACTYPTLLDAKRIYISNTHHYHYRQRFDSMVKNRSQGILGIDKLQIMYNYLKERFLASPYKDNLMAQLEKFLLSLLVVRGIPKQTSGRDVNNLFPFGNVAEGSNVIIYGLGTFGQHLYQRVKMDSKYEIVAAVDNNYHLMQNVGFPVLGLEALSDTTYDYVLITFVNEEIARQKSEEISGYGVPAHKILRLDKSIVQNPKTVLEDYGIVL
jgi:glycosyltransferase involved in cell wall biosynthesis